MKKMLSVVAVGLVLLMGTNAQAAERHYLVVDVHAEKGSLLVVETPDVLSDWPKMKKWKTPSEFKNSEVKATWQNRDQGAIALAQYGIDANSQMTPVVGYNIEGTNEQYVEQISRIALP